MNGASTHQDVASSGLRTRDPEGLGEPGAWILDPSVGGCVDAFCCSQVNNSTILGASGDYADYQYLKQVIEQMV